MNLFKVQSHNAEWLESAIEEYREALEEVVQTGKVIAPFAAFGALLDPATAEEGETRVLVDIADILEHPENTEAIAGALRDFAKEIKAIWSVIVIPGDVAQFPTEGEADDFKQAVVFLTELSGETVDSRVAFVELGEDTGKLISFDSVAYVEGTEAFRHLINAMTN